MGPARAATPCSQSLRRSLPARAAGGRRVVAAMSEWIKVSERSPELDAGMTIDVWTFDTGGEVRIDQWSTENADDGEFVANARAHEFFEEVAPRGDPDCICIPPARITHWMEIEYPEPPGESA